LWLLNLYHQWEVPKKDPKYDADAARLKQEYYSGDLLLRLENERKEMLQVDWQPNKDWWGSKVLYE